MTVTGYDVKLHTGLIREREPCFSLSLANLYEEMRSVGVFIYLSVSTTVTQEEWEPVYQEALDLAQKLQLSEVRKINIGGVTVNGFAVTQEHTEVSEWNQERWTGFDISGDYKTLQWAETNGFPR